MADDNKPLKYMRYAIGEIALVVIGILIALYINNWNIENSNKKIEKQLLISLQKDFMKTKANLKSTIKLQTNVVNLSKTLMAHYITKNTNIGKDSIYNMFYSGASAFWRIEPTNGTYQSMLSSGDSKLLQSKKLLQTLTEYSGEINYGFEDHDVSIDLILNIIYDLGNHSELAINPLHYIDSYKTPENYNQTIEQEINRLYKNHGLFTKIDNRVDFATNRLKWQIEISHYVDTILNEIEIELKRMNNDQFL